MPGLIDFQDASTIAGKTYGKPKIEHV